MVKDFLEIQKPDTIKEEKDIGSFYIQFLNFLAGIMRMTEGLKVDFGIRAPKEFYQLITWPK